MNGDGMDGREAIDRLDPEELPHLAAFLGGYLHEDWILDYASAAEAAWSYLLEADLEAAEALAVEWGVLAAAARALPLDELNRILRARFGSGWNVVDAAEIRAVSAELERALDE
jgi:hypothetical protein